MHRSPYQVVHQQSFVNSAVTNRAMQSEVASACLPAVALFPCAVIPLGTACLHSRHIEVKIDIAYSTATLSEQYACNVCSAETGQRQQRSRIVQPRLLCALFPILLEEAIHQARAARSNAGAEERPAVFCD